MKRRLRQIVRRHRQRGYSVITLLCYLCTSLGFAAELPGAPGVGCQCDSSLQQSGNCCCSKRINFLQSRLTEGQPASAGCCAGAGPASVQTPPTLSSTARQSADNSDLPACCQKTVPANPAVPACCQPPVQSVKTSSTCCPPTSCCSPAPSAEEVETAADSLPGYRSACGCGHEPISGFLLNGDPRLLLSACAPQGGWLQTTLGWENLGWKALLEGPDTPPPRR